MYTEEEPWTDHRMEVDAKTMESICGDYREGKGCVQISIETELPLQTIIREIRDRTGGGGVRM